MRNPERQVVLVARDSETTLLPKNMIAKDVAAAIEMILGETATPPKEAGSSLSGARVSAVVGESDRHSLMILLEACGAFVRWGFAPLHAREVDSKPGSDLVIIDCERVGDEKVVRALISQSGAKAVVLLGWRGVPQEFTDRTLPKPISAREIVAAAALALERSRGMPSGVG
jgi:hypothetical protein